MRLRFDILVRLMFCLAAMTALQDAHAAVDAADAVGETPLTLEQTQPLGGDSVRTDTVMHDGDYWKRQLRSGKLDLNDESIVYPSFLQMCVNIYRWGDRTFNSYDPDYVVGTGKRCKALVKNEEWMDSYAMRFPGKKSLSMISNVSINFGAYVSYMALSVGYSGEVNRLFDGRGTGQRKLEFQFTCALLAADGYWVKNTGGTNIKRFGDYNGGQWVNEAFPGLVRESYGADIYYFFNHRKYSQGAAYSFSKLQKRSAGSMIAGLTISHQNVGLDFAKLPAGMEVELPDDRTVYRFKYNDYCFLLGYGYNWVFKPNWLFNISVLPSIGYKHCFRDNIDGYDDIFSVNIKGKMGLVHNHKKFFYGMCLKLDGHWYKSSNYSFFNSVESMSLIVGYRFDIF